MLGAGSFQISPLFSSEQAVHTCNDAVWKTTSETKRWILAGRQKDHMSCSWCILTVGFKTALTYIYNITIRRVRRAALHPHCTPSSSQPLWGSASQGNNQERGGQPLCPGLEKTLRPREGNAYGQILLTYSTFSDYPAVFLRRKPEMQAMDQVAL